jgi:hypothetical protein
VGWVMPIHKAQPEVKAKATPAKRMPQAPERAPFKRNSNHGPKVKDTEVPMENKAMIKAPSHALADKDATNRAEYNKPQGMSAQATPSMTGALAPMRVSTGLARRHTACAQCSIHAGWRARQSKAKPMSKAATWNMVHKGLTTAVFVPNQAKPCTEPAANAPKAA